MAHPYQELRAFTINMKSLDQEIEDPIIAGAGDANGRTLRIVFTQEAAAQLTPECGVYLSWTHLQRKNCSGLNDFHKVNENPAIYEISYSRSMLHEGDVLCCIKIVDEISIVNSVNFIVHVLTDPDDGTGFVVSDDYSVFQQAVIDLSITNKKAQDLMTEHKLQFEKIKDELTGMKETVDEAYQKSTEAYELAKKALDQVAEKDTSQGVFLTEY